MDKPNKKNKKKESASYDDELLEKILNDSKPKRYGKEEENPFDVYLERQKEQAPVEKSAGSAEPTVVTEVVEEIKVTEVNNTTAVTEVTTMEKSEESAPKETVSKETPTPKATRISAKMRQASREEFCETYLRKCDTKFGKPITIEPELMERLYNICLLAGVRNACPTYLVNNLIREIISAWEEQAKGW